MAFSTEEILQEFEDLAACSAEHCRAEGLRVVTGRQSGMREGRECLSDDARAERHRRTARASAARVYARKGFEERNAPIRKFLASVRADPVRHAAYLRRKRAADKRYKQKKRQQK